MAQGVKILDPLLFLGETPGHINQDLEEPVFEAPLRVISFEIFKGPHQGFLPEPSPPGPFLFQTFHTRVYLD